MSYKQGVFVTSRSTESVSEYFINDAGRLAPPSTDYKGATRGQINAFFSSCHPADQASDCLPPPLVPDDTNWVGSSVMQRGAYSGLMSVNKSTGAAFLGSRESRDGQRLKVTPKPSMQSFNPAKKQKSHMSGRSRLPSRIATPVIQSFAQSGYNSVVDATLTRKEGQRSFVAKETGCAEGMFFSDVKKENDKISRTKTLGTKYGLSDEPGSRKRSNADMPILSPERYTSNQVYDEPTYAVLEEYDHKGTWTSTETRPSLDSNGSDVTREALRLSNLERKMTSLQNDEAVSPPQHAEQLNVIYMDWANHYLEQAKHKRLLKDLQSDLVDGVLLGAVVHAVTGKKTEGLRVNPRNSAEMLENIELCLTHLEQIGVQVDGLSAQDIQAGSLRAILGLFFAISRYKQLQKSSSVSQTSAGAFQQSSKQKQSSLPTPSSRLEKADSETKDTAVMLSRLPSRFKSNNHRPPTSSAKQDNKGGVVKKPTSMGATSPVSAPQSTFKRQGVGYSSERPASRPKPAVSEIVGLSNKAATTSRESSRSASPSNAACSSIPTPSSLRSAASASGGGSGIKPPSTYGRTLFQAMSTWWLTGSTGQRPLSSSSSKCSSQESSSGATSSATAGSSDSTPRNSGSMLDKFKLFNSKSKSAKGSKSAKNGQRPESAEPTVREQVSRVASPNQASRLALGEPEPQNASSPKLGLRSRFGLKSKQKDVPSPPQRQESMPQHTAAKQSSLAQRRPLSPPGDPSLRPKSDRTCMPLPPTPTSYDQTVSAVSMATGPVKSRPSSGKSLSSKPSKSSATTQSGRSGIKPPAIPANPPPAQLPSQTAAAASTAIPKPGQGKTSGSKSTDSLRLSNHKSHSSSSKADIAVSQQHSKHDKERAREGHSKNYKHHQRETEWVPEGMHPQQQQQQHQQQQSSRSTQQHHAEIANHHHYKQQVDDAAQRTHVKPPESALPQKKASKSAGSKSNYGSAVAMGAKASAQSGVYHTAPAAASQLQQSSMLSQPKVKAAKVDSDTQTNSVSKVTSGAKKCEKNGVAEATDHKQNVANRAMEQLAKKKEHCSAIKSQGASSVDSVHLSSEGENNSKSSERSTSNSNNSVSSNDSVIYRPSSCDELESGLESEHGTPVKKLTPLSRSSAQPMDHISSLRKSREAQMKSSAASQTPKKETTFSSATAVPVHRASSVNDDAAVDDVTSIKPMQPIMRSTPYSYLRTTTSSTTSPYARPNLQLSSSGAQALNSASNRLGVNKPLLDPNKIYGPGLKRVASTNHAADLDAMSEPDNDVSGYMSDGDILKHNHMEDVNSGYMSEGGAGLYAARLQQRMRDGMQAVRECMKNSSGLNDGNDSFDDSSSVSSGEISDAINELSTEDNVTTTTVSSLGGSSIGSARKIQPSGTGRSGLAKASLSNSLRGVTDSVDAWRQLGERQYDAQHTGSGESPAKRAELGAKGHYPPPLKKAPPATPVRRSTPGGSLAPSTGIAVEDPAFDVTDLALQQRGSKVDSETNTDVSAIRNCRQQELQRPQSANAAMTSRSNPGNRTLPMDSRTAAQQRSVIARSAGTASPDLQARTSTAAVPSSDVTGMHSLERRQKGLFAGGSKTILSPPVTSPMSIGMDEQRASTLGRKKPGQSSPTDAKGLVNGTIISNPHATFTRERLGGRIANTDLSPTGLHGNGAYVNVNYHGGASSAASSPSHGPHNAAAAASANSWLKSSHGTAVLLGQRFALSEAESMESLASAASSSIQAQIMAARAHGQASKNILQSQQGGSNHYMEQIYAKPNQSDLHRSGSHSPLNGVSNATSPTNGATRLSVPFSSYTIPKSSPYRGGGGGGGGGGEIAASNAGLSRNDDAHGSASSLVSSCSSVYSTKREEHQEQELRKLRRELDGAHDKVSTLSTQLSTNAHVVAAFEQSLANMTSRLQTLSSSAEAKDSELEELRATIEFLKQKPFSPEFRRQSSAGADHGMCDDSRRGLTRHTSSESVSSINSLSSACSATSAHSSVVDVDGKKNSKSKNGKGANKNWLRSSFTKAFARKNKKGEPICDGDADSSLMNHGTFPLSGSTRSGLDGGTAERMKPSHTSDSLSDALTRDEALLALQQQLRDKDMKLTDIRLEALNSFHQLEQMRDAMIRMKNEMTSLKADNHRLQRMMNPGSCASSVAASPTESGVEKTFPVAAAATVEAAQPSLELLLPDAGERSSKLITLSVQLNCSAADKPSETSTTSLLIGAVPFSSKLGWEMLDLLVKKVFSDYILRIDNANAMGLNGDSVSCYRIGDLTRSEHLEVPELLPCGYLVGENTNISLVLKGTDESTVDSMSFETLVPRSILQRYISLLTEHRRIILCGPSGTGKSYMAQKLAEHLVFRSLPGRQVETRIPAGSIATFKVNAKSSKELRQYLANIAEQCESNPSGDLPTVIILDNLHHVSSLGEVFNGLLSVKVLKCPYIIGTMNQATCSTTNLQLHHNFRWVLYANHMEPVRGFLSRWLHRKLVEAEVSSGVQNKELSHIIDWVPKIWQHLNKFLETHSSADVTIGPRLFLSCPMEPEAAQVWFTDLWNYSIVPYMLDAIREGLQTYGRRAAWEDPATYVLETFPWSTLNQQGEMPSLLRLRPEDVGFDLQPPVASGAAANKQAVTSKDSAAAADGDPILTMLMRLQEAANYSSPQSQDSDTQSLDSHTSGLDGDSASVTSSSSNNKV